MLSISSSLVYDGGTLQELSAHTCRSSDSAIDPKYSLNVLAISLFLKIISPFSCNIMSVSALLCLFEKACILPKKVYFLGLNQYC